MDEAPAAVGFAHESAVPGKEGDGHVFRDGVGHRRQLADVRDERSRIDRSTREVVDRAPREQCVARPNGHAM